MAILEEIEILAFVDDSKRVCSFVGRNNIYYYKVKDRRIKEAIRDYIYYHWRDCVSVLEQKIVLRNLLEIELTLIFIKRDFRTIVKEFKKDFRGFVKKF